MFIEELGDMIFGEWKVYDVSHKRRSEKYEATLRPHDNSKYGSYGCTMYAEGSSMRELYNRICALTGSDRPTMPVPKKRKWWWPWS